MKPRITDTIIEFMRGLGDATIRCDELSLFLPQYTQTQVSQAVGKLVQSGKIENRAEEGHPGEYRITRVDRTATLRMREWKPLGKPLPHVHRATYSGAPGVVIREGFSGRVLA